MTTCQSELDDVKTQYVSVCEERAAVESRLTSEWEEKLNVELHALRVELNAQQQQVLDEQCRRLDDHHQAALAGARDTWLQEQQAALASARDTWRQEQQAQFKQNLENEVSAISVGLNL